MLKCKVQHKMQQWGVVALLAGGMLLPPPAVSLAAEAGAGTARASISGATEADRKAIAAAYRQSDAAYDDFNLEGVWQGRTENFIVIGADGSRFGADQLKENMARIFKTAESMKCRTTIQKMVLQGNKATVEARNVSMMSVPAAGTSSTALTLASRSTDTWVKLNGRWLLSSAKVHSNYMTRNGQPLGGTAAPGTAVATTASATETARKTIQAAYNAMSAAAARRDARGALGNRTADYVAIDLNGTRVTGEEMEEIATVSYALSESISGWIKIEKFVLKGNTATVTTRGAGTVIFPAYGKYKRTVYKMTDRSRDTWVKRDGQWFISRSQALAGYLTENGKFARKKVLRRR